MQQKEQLEWVLNGPKLKLNKTPDIPPLQTRDRKNCFLDHLVPSRQVKVVNRWQKKSTKSGVCFCQVTTSKGKRNTYQRTSRLSPVISLSLLHAPTSIILLYIGARISPSMRTKSRH